jgi:hypothetical protein
MFAIGSNPVTPMLPKAKVPTIPSPIRATTRVVRCPTNSTNDLSASLIIIFPPYRFFMLCMSIRPYKYK